MHNIIWLISIVFLLFGCSSKEEKAFLTQYEKKLSYHKELHKTEKLQLYSNENITQLLILATYITDNTDNTLKSSEKFIISIDSESEEILSLNSKEYHLWLNKMKPASITLLNSDDERLKNISFTSSWSRYYLVTFNHIKNKTLTLDVESTIYGKGALHFAKVAKYVLSNKAY